MQDFLDPNKILKEIGLKKNMVAAEFGCGSGTFVIGLAKELKEEKVYGLDAQEEPLSALMGKVRQERLSNIETIRCNLEEEGGSTLPDDFLDLILIPNVLFQADNKKAVIRESERILKKHGKVLIIDYKKDSSFGPKTGKISAEEVKKIAKELGLSLKKELSAGAFHYVLLFQKS